MRGKLKAILAALVMGLVLPGCGPKADSSIKSAAESPGKGSGVVTGKVVLKGKAPAPAVYDLSSDSYCKQHYGGTIRDESVVQNADGTLQNVFVYVKVGAGKYPSPTEPAVLEMKECRHSPHVMGVQAGQPFEVVNDETLMDTIRCVALLNDGFNVARPDKGLMIKKVFNLPEVMIKMTCDLHAWESNYVGVVNNPFFAVTGAQGDFTIKGLPAGSYLLEAWHEKYGTSGQAVTLQTGETRSVDFTFNTK